MRVLILGSGGRELALAMAALGSPKVTFVACSPGNAGMKRSGITCIPAKDNSNATYVEIAQTNEIDLVIVGPEGLLAQDIRGAFDQAGIRCFGPTQAATWIESSKVFAKQLMSDYSVPTATYGVFRSASHALQYVESHFAGGTKPLVIKANGLCAGKGVTVAQTVEEARKAIDDCMITKIFGTEGETILIEECLYGEEASVFALVGWNSTIQLLGSAKDFKRLRDGDQGPNTGSMGSISPHPRITRDVEQWLLENVFEPIVQALSENGCPYEGFLYASIMFTEDGIKVIEFNARFGDPEAQVVLLRLESDLIEHILDVMKGNPNPTPVQWITHQAVCVILASEGYPEKPIDGRPITGLEEAERSAFIFYAGVAEKDGILVTKGGRVLGAVGLGKYEKAGEIAYLAANAIQFEGKQQRSDIG